MKKILYTTAIAALLVGAGGCKKSQLDLFPYNQVETTQAFKTSADVSYAVNGMYQGLRASGSYFIGSWNIVADVLADNLIMNPVGRQSQRTYYQYLYSSSSTYGLFSGGYTIIRRANAILENIGTFPAGTFKNNVTGQALALRAMTYFDMSRVYSKTYLNASATDYTMPYVTVTDATIKPASESVTGFYDKVIADLVAAEALINSRATNTNIFLNKEAVAGLLSRVYLYKGDYANCIAAANRSLGATPNVGTLATFPGIWTDAVGSDAAVLFKVKNTAIDNVNTQGTNYYQITGGQKKSEYQVDYNFYQLFDNTDIRKSVYIETSLYLGNNYNHIIKYNGRGGTSPAGVVDGKALRTAEVLLNRMEAEARLGGASTAAAAADLALLKTDRYTGYVSAADLALTGTSLLTEILKQRRLELAFEGDRFWDLKRLNLPVTRDGTKGERADGTGTPPAITTLAVGDYKRELPYPQTETLFNPALKQNPGGY